MNAPDEEYRTAREAAVVIDRSDLGVLRLHGRDPLRMVQGLISNDLAGAPDDRAVYATVLTPKGRIIADVRALRRAGDVWLLCEAAALQSLKDHLARSIPPLFARVDDRTGAWGILGVFGPHAARATAAALGRRPEDLAGVPEEGLITDGDGALALRTRYAGVDGYDVVAAAEQMERLWDGLRSAGATPAGQDTLETLRIEAGRPRWGAELTDEVIPLEAGLRSRAISETKGCYTGQEVIVRILHRGHVNRHLRGLLLGDHPPPPRGASLVRAGETKELGRVTSACVSPAHGQTIGLGYVRREVEPPGDLVLEPDGAAVRVVALPFDGAPGANGAA